MTAPTDPRPLDERIREFFRYPVDLYALDEMAEIIGVPVESLKLTIDETEIDQASYADRPTAERAAVHFCPARTIEAALAGEDRDYKLPELMHAQSITVTLPAGTIHALEAEAARLNDLPHYAGAPVPRTVEDVIAGFVRDHLAADVDQIHELEQHHPEHRRRGPVSRHAQGANDRGELLRVCHRSRIDRTRRGGDQSMNVWIALDGGSVRSHYLAIALLVFSTIGCWPREANSRGRAGELPRSYALKMDCFGMTMGYAEERRKHYEALNVNGVTTDVEAQFHCFSRTLNSCVAEFQNTVTTSSEFSQFTLLTDVLTGERLLELSYYSARDAGEPYVGERLLKAFPAVSRDPEKLRLAVRADCIE